MSFNRKEFFGLNFEWYMTDAAGSLAMFISGYGPIPKSVFENADGYSELKYFFQSLPVLSNSFYDSESNEIGIDGSNSLFCDVKAVSRGLYVFDNEEYTDNYKLIAIPKTTLNVSTFEKRIQNLLEPFAFRDTIFGEVTSLNIADHFECDK